ncbi:MAG: conserved rane protein of unknown function [Blastococcus sp.]|nr:conserved rane protein of unknown function [Blastococcus sp.]
MAISVLEVRDIVVPPRVRVPSLRLVPAASATSATSATEARRLPVAVLAASLIGIAEAVALLAVALTGIDGVLDSPLRPPGWLLACGLVLLAGWIVLSAGGGAALIDGAGRRLVLTVAYCELALLGLLGVVAITTPVIAAAPGGLPLPLLLLVLAAVPVGKLLLVGAPSSARWIAAGPRVRERRIDPVAAHRLLATLTLGVIAVSLAAVAVLLPVHDSGLNAPASAVFTQH